MPDCPHSDCKFDERIDEYVCQLCGEIVLTAQDEDEARTCPRCHGSGLDWEGLGECGYCDGMGYKWWE